MKNKLRKWLGIDELNGRIIDDRDTISEDFSEIRSKIKELSKEINKLKEEKLNRWFLDESHNNNSLTRFISAVNELIRISGRTLVEKYVEEAEPSQTIRRKKIWRLEKNQKPKN